MYSRRQMLFLGVCRFILLCSEHTEGNLGSQSNGAKGMSNPMSAEPPERLSDGYFIAQKKRRMEHVQ